MTKVRRSERGSDRGSFILLGLMVLAIAASIVMLVTGNIDVLKIALIVSLWAAFVGLFLVARSRKETERVRLLKQQESAVAQAEISRLEAAADIESETLAEIRDQLEVMRTQLEALTNLAFPESGMIQAQARRHRTGNHRTEAFSCGYPHRRGHRLPHRHRPHLHGCRFPHPSSRGHGGR